MGGILCFVAPAFFGFQERSNEETRLEIKFVGRYIDLEVRVYE